MPRRLTFGLVFLDGRRSVSGRQATSHLCQKAFKFTTLEVVVAESLCGAGTWVAVRRFVRLGAP